MSTLKKILSLSLALAMLMSVSVFAGFADAAEIDKDAAAAVELLAAVKILNGFEKEDGTFEFKPTETIQRDQAAKMIYVLRNGGVDDKAETWKAAVSFADVAKDNWAAGYIAYCETYGIINGRTATVFDPTAPLTGIELAKLLLTVAGYKGDVEGYTGTGWEKNVVADANEAGLFVGVKDALTQPITRQYAAVMFKNAFDAQIPVYIGDYRIDGIAGSNQTVAEKFLDFEVSEPTTVLATKTAKVTGDYAATGKTVLASGTVDFVVADALVGQQVKVTKIKGEIVTIAATGKTIAGELKVGAKITSGTDANKYPVTVGGVSIGNKAADYVICGTLTVQNVLDQQAKKGNWVAYTAFDANGDKTVDYVANVTTAFGVVGTISTAEATKGDFSIGEFYVDVSDAKFTVNGTMKAGIVAKYTVDSMTGKVVVAPADIVMGSFTGVSGTKFTVGGTQYEYADEALEKEFLSSDTITTLVKDTVVLYTDGKYIVKAVKFVVEDTTPDTTPTALPSKLALLLDARVIEETYTEEDPWVGTVTRTRDVLKVEVLLADGTKVVLPYEDSTSSTVVKDADLSATELTEAVADFKGGVFEYTITSNGKILFKEKLVAVKDVDFYGSVDADGALTSNGAMGAAVTYNATSKLLTGIADTFIMGTDNTKVFVVYTYDEPGKTAKTEYKVMKVTDLTAYEIDSLKLIAATDASIGEGLLAVAEISWKAATTTPSTPAAHYVIATSAVEYKVEGEKIYMVFTAIDLKNNCAAATFKAEVKTSGTADLSDVAKGAILTLSTTDGLVTSAVAETWTKASITAKAGNLLLVNGSDIWQTSGTETKFAANCKVILKNGDAYTTGSIDNLVVAKKVDSAYKNNIKYVLGTGDNATKVAYVIIDLDGDID